MPNIPNSFSAENDPAQILNWRRWNGKLTTSGQPTEDQLAAIREIGVTHVINLGLHSHEKAIKDEFATVSRLGMTYIHIPVEFTAPTDSDFHLFCKSMEEAEGARVHVHCIFNARVTAFLYRYQRDILKVEQERAAALMETVWRPGGVWATFLGHDAAVKLPDRYAGRDY